MTKLQLNTRCFRQIQAILNQISRGLEDYDGKPQVRLDALRGALAEACLGGDTLLNFKTAPRGVKQGDEKEMLAAYFRFVHRAGREAGIGHDIRPLPLHLDAEDQGLFLEVFGDEHFYDRVPNPRKSGSFAFGAFDLAMYNRRMTESRIASLDFLTSLYADSYFREADLGASAARSNLYGKAQRFTADILKFAVVLNDPETFELVRSEICAPALGAGMSVAQYLQPDGGIPSAWPENVETAFRAELKNLLAAPAPVLLTSD